MLPFVTDPNALAHAAVALMSQTGELRSYERARAVQSRWLHGIDPRMPWPNPWQLVDGSGYDVVTERLGRDWRLTYRVDRASRLVTIAEHPAPGGSGLLLAVALAEIALGDRGNIIDPWLGALDLLAPASGLMDLAHYQQLVMVQPHMPAEFAIVRWRQVRTWAVDSEEPPSRMKLYR